MPVKLFAGIFFMINFNVVSINLFYYFAIATIVYGYICKNFLKKIAIYVPRTFQSISRNDF